MSRQASMSHAPIQGAWGPGACHVWLGGCVCVHSVSVAVCVHSVCVIWWLGVGGGSSVDYLGLIPYSMPPQPACLPPPTHPVTRPLQGYGDKKFVFQGVHETICYGPSEKPWAPSEQRINRIVFIGKGISRKVWVGGWGCCCYCYLCCSLPGHLG